MRWGYNKINKSTTETSRWLHEEKSDNYKKLNGSRQKPTVANIIVKTVQKTTFCFILFFKGKISLTVIMYYTWNRQGFSETILFWVACNILAHASFSRIFPGVGFVVVSYARLSHSSYISNEHSSSGFQGWSYKSCWV